MVDNQYGDLLLGQHTDYTAEYDASLLCPIARSLGRERLGIEGKLPFHGADLWTAYELSWLDRLGKPQVAIADFSYPCDSDAIIESKSFKLYLNSFNQMRYESAEQLEAVMKADLSAVAGAEVSVKLWLPQDWPSLPVSQLPGQSLDQQAISIDCYQANSGLLQVDSSSVTEQTWHSHLLRSLCPVTGQPDWGSVVIDYQGGDICPQGLLKYIVSYREHQDFHEQCVERIFSDIMYYCQPQRLTVYARYVRRGGLDINPYRSTESGPVDSLRLVRQ